MIEVILLILGVVVTAGGVFVAYETGYRRGLDDGREIWWPRK